MSIPGKLVRLRPAEHADLPTLHEWANDEVLWQNLGGWRFPSSMQGAEQWFANHGKDPLNHHFVIVQNHSDVPVGTANLVSLDWKNRHATHGMLLGSSAFRGKGLARDTVMAIMRYAFDELGLERLESDIIEFNKASYKLYVGRCGWREEGRQRRWHYRLGQFWDRILVGVTREDYAALLQANRYWDTVALEGSAP